MASAMCIAPPVPRLLLAMFTEDNPLIYFEGRLAQYKYFNTDEIIERALTLFNQLKKKKSNKI